GAGGRQGDSRRVLGARPLLRNARLERRDQRGRRGEAVARVLRHRAVEDRVLAWRDVRPERANARHGLLEVLERNGHEVLALEGRAAGEQLEEEDAERVLVRAGVDRLAPRLFRRDVVARAEERSRLREAVLAVEGA